jgi:DNA-directed RNA polymerase specialized sigma24 family protein
MRAESASRIDLAFSQHVPYAARLAYLLTGDAALAHRLARRAFDRAIGHWQDVRGEDILQEFVLRQVVTSVRHRSLFSARSIRARPRRGRSQPPSREDAVEKPRSEHRPPDELWRALLRLGVRRRVAVVLTHWGDLDEAQAAEVLECSVGGLRSLSASGTRALAAGRSPSRLSERLPEELQRRAAELPPGPQLTPEDTRHLRRRKTLLALGAVLLSVLSATAAVGGTLAVIRRAREANNDPLTSEEFRRVTEAAPKDLGGPCPPKSKMLPISNGRSQAQRLARLAEEFNASLIENDPRSIRRLSFFGRRSLPWASTSTTRGVKVTLSAPVGKNELPSYRCGARVARRTWKVVMHDANGTTSRGIASFYLVQTREGWKVWASWEPRP